MNLKKSGGGNGRKKAKTVLSIAAMVIMVLFTTAFLGFRYYANLLAYDHSTSDEYIDDTDYNEPMLDVSGKELTSEEHVMNILLIGIDSEEGTSRSDTMLLVSVNESTGQIVLTSFLRDTYVTIPDKGENRLNAAYAYGGASLLIKTLQYNFGISIDNYALVGFSEFENIVNILGGVTVELTDAEIEDLVVDLGGTNTMHMDGAWALRFVRIRKLDSDFGRTDRQRRLLASIMTEFKSASVFELNNLLTQILPQVTTDLIEKDLLNMVLSWGKYSKYDIVASSIPVEGGYKYDTVNGMSVLTIDLDANKSAIVDNIYNGALNAEENGFLNAEE